MPFLFQVAAISEQASELTEDPNPEKFSSPSVWKSFDMHAVVDSTEDLLLFILSEKGQRVRVFLLRDIVEAADVFLQDEVIDCALNGNRQDQRILRFEVLSLVKKNSCVCVQGNTKFLMAPCHVHRLCIKWQCGEKCTNLSV
jgi:hypothetical protein